MQASAVFPRFRRGKTTLEMRLHLIIYREIPLKDSDFRKFSVARQAKKCARRLVWPITCVVRAITSSKELANAADYFKDIYNA